MGSELFRNMVSQVTQGHILGVKMFFSRLVFV